MSKTMPHERLHVYDKALSVVRTIAAQVELWPSMHSVRDQADRALESLITNLIKAAWHQPSRQAVYHLECSLGSVLECAACLDVARVKGLVGNEQATAWKQSLLEVARMEVGLRKSWSVNVCEESGQYGEKEPTFPHESLQVYQRALRLCQVLATNILTPDKERSRYARRIDEASTSLLLNIAEGNGRFSQLDHRQFIAAAEEAGVKLAAYLDLISPGSSVATESARSVLREVMAMLVGLKGYLEAGSAGK